MNYAKKARVALKMTQHDMAAALGVSQPTISRAENGEIDPRTKLAIRGLLAQRRVKEPT